MKCYQKNIPPKENNIFENNEFRCERIVNETLLGMFHTECPWLTDEDAVLLVTPKEKGSPSFFIAIQIREGYEPHALS